MPWKIVHSHKVSPDSGQIKTNRALQIGVSRGFLESSYSDISLRMGLCGAFQTCSALLLATMVVKQLVFKTTAELGKERDGDGAS